MAKKPDEFKNFQVRFRGEDKDKLERIAKRTGYSEADVLRKAIRVLDCIGEQEMSLATKDGAIIPASIILA